MQPFEIVHLKLLHDLGVFYESAQAHREPSQSSFVKRKFNIWRLSGQAIPAVVYRPLRDETPWMVLCVTCVQTAQCRHLISQAYFRLRMLNARAPGLRIRVCNTCRSGDSGTHWFTRLFTTCKVASVFHRRSTAVWTRM